MESILHIRGQEAWHDDVIIMGTHIAIKELMNACKNALDNKGFPFHVNSFVKDGEGYEVTVQVMSEEHMENVELPYYADYTKPFVDSVPSEQKEKD